VKYGLVIETAAIEAIAAMPEIPHDLFTLACLDIGADPHGLHGVTGETAGHVATRTWAVGSMGFLVYEVDEEAAVVTITKVISML
jgi:hypothetical protein